ncbi:MAG: hypothetical protein LIO94_07075 [Clostridiales bacterium]|nr:hypothetical protein [Clostridiales bacterium]
MLGENHMLGVNDSNNRVYTWGDNTYKQLGNQQAVQNGSSAITSPSDSSFASSAHLVAIDSADYNFIDVASGTNHSIGIVVAESEVDKATQGTVYAWGDNSKGQLGQGTATGSSAALLSVKKSDGTAITNAVAVAAAADYSMALTTDGTVYVWGDNTYGVAGSGSKGGTVTYATAVSGITGDGTLTSISSIAATKTNAVAVGTNGRVYSWGANDNGQIGDASYFERLYPVMQSDVTSIESVAAGIGFVVALSEEGNMYAWGANESGQLGNSTYDEQLVPVATGANSKLTIRSAKIVTNTNAGEIVTSEEFTTFAMLEASSEIETVAEFEAEVSADDADNDGSISLMSASVSLFSKTDDTEYDTLNTVPRTITLTNDSSGNIQQFVLDKDAVYDEFRYYLNLVSETGSDEFKVEDIYMIAADSTLFSVDDDWIVTPTQKAIDNKYAVTTLIIQDRTRNISQTFELEYMTTAIDGDSTTQTIETAPMVASNAHNSIALMSDGTVWTWGDNTYGQLGNKSNEASYIPVQVRNPISDKYLTDVIKVAQGAYHSVALTSDGQVYTWGLGASGQLGNGSTDNSTIPVAVVNGDTALSGIVDIAAGEDFTAALDENGYVWMFGNNEDGLLGINKTDDIQLTPQRVLAGKSKSTSS